MKEKLNAILQNGSDIIESTAFALEEDGTNGKIKKILCCSAAVINVVVACITAGGEPQGARAFVAAAEEFVKVNE